MTDNLSLMFNYGTIDVDNSAFTLACELVDGCVTAVVGTLDPIGTLRNLGGNSDSGSLKIVCRFVWPMTRKWAVVSSRPT